MPRSELS